MLMPGASFRSSSPSPVTSMTARSVMMRLTTRRPVSGRVHSLTIFADPQALVALDEILRRIPDFAIPDGYTPVYSNNSVARKNDELNVAFTQGHREGYGAGDT